MNPANDHEVGFAWHRVNLSFSPQTDHVIKPLIEMNEGRLPLW